MSLRVRIAVAACKLANRACKLLGKNGTSLPGLVALRLCPDLLASLAQDIDVVIVTGTNGKTTTSHMLSEMLAQDGRRVLNNRSGANLVSGIADAFALDAHLSGSPRSDVAVIECDEATLRHVAAALKPRVILVTNIFRDQLDRYGEVTTILDLIRQGVELAPEALLCLNADCSLTSSLGQVGNDSLFFGLGVDVGSEDSAAVPLEGIFCLQCGTAYEYSFRTFGHLGGFSCPECGAARPQADVEVSAIHQLADDASDADFTITLDGAPQTHRIHVGLPGIFNLYNAAAALAVALHLGVSLETAQSALGTVTSSFGRMESFLCGSTPVRLILVKNPTGMDQGLRYARDSLACSRIVFGLNDRAADGTDISWIWDADFEGFFQGREGLDVLVYGIRAADMLLRLKYAGASLDSLRPATGNQDLIDFISQGQEPVCMLLSYTALLEVRSFLEHRFNLGGIA